jgi:acyl-CoA hydrolase
MKLKSSSDSVTVMNEMVLPNDTNPLNNLRGGKLLHWMDIAGVISAQKHSGQICVTVSVDNVSFDNPIKLGHVVTITARVVKTFRTSMEVHVSVWSQNLISGEKCKSNEAFYTFVAIDKNAKTVPVPAVETENEEEYTLAEHAVLRKQLKLLLAGKISIKDAPELKQQFSEWIKEA